MLPPPSSVFPLQGSLSGFLVTSHQERKSARLRVGSCRWCCHLNPYLHHYRVAFASSTFLYPQFHLRSLRLAFRSHGGTLGLPRSIQVPEWVRSCLSAGDTPSAIGELGAPIPDPLPFGTQAYDPCGVFSIFSLAAITTFISNSHVLTMPFHSSPRPPRCW